MARLVALFVCALVSWGLFRLDPEPKGRTSAAAWIPFLWVFIAASRNVSEWLQLREPSASDAYLEGSPLDRTILSLILALGVIVLLKRQRQVGALLRSNGPLLMYFGYCLISVLWSDFPDVSIKRWFRALGDVVMILIVLTEMDWQAAFQRLITRLAYLLVPLSILFIRYYPQLGRSYSRGGAPSWTGVASDKNALGMICMVFGLAAIFRSLQILAGEKGAGNRRALKSQVAIILMALYLLWEANSATAFACFFLAGGVMLLTYLFQTARKPVVLHTLVATVLIVPMSAMFLGIGSGLVQDLGRNSTFTGRTDVWRFALGAVENPILGAGYESFWLGPRLREIQRLLEQGVNQAHNGYLEIYLNLGWVGIAVLAVLLISGYRRIIPAVRSRTDAGSLRLAYFVAAVAYNFSEGGFKMMHPVWIFLLLSILVLPNTAVPKSTTAGVASRGSPPGALLHARPHGPEKPEAVLPEFIRRCIGISHRVSVEWLGIPARVAAA